MNTNHHTEQSYENTLIQLFQDLGYAYECGYDVYAHRRGIAPRKLCFSARYGVLT